LPRNNRHADHDMSPMIIIPIMMPIIVITMAVIVPMGANG
jgi:hypothetical protein